MTHSNFRNGIIIGGFFEHQKQLLSSKHWFGVFGFDQQLLVQCEKHRVSCATANDISYFFFGKRSHDTRHVNAKGPHYKMKYHENDEIRTSHRRWSLIVDSFCLLDIIDR